VNRCLLHKTQWLISCPECDAMRIACLEDEARLVIEEFFSEEQNHDRIRTTNEDR
jgi:hypothetical protein